MIKNSKSLMDKARNTANKNNITVNEVLKTICLKEFWKG